MPTSRPPGSRRRRIATFAALALAALLGRLRRYEISEHSMRPTLDDGDRVIATSRSHAMRPGDVVIVDHPERRGFELVKRISSIGPDGVIVLGDDPGAGSVDSVMFGPVPAAAITARVLLRYRPLPPRFVR